ncbi:hypothetical protein KW795_02920 [Candidatus Microgenomates bacterium]|nr:hypothetical protein [Candidatus Microgenomates bacterium]
MNNDKKYGTDQDTQMGNDTGSTTVSDEEKKEQGNDEEGTNTGNDDSDMGEGNDSQEGSSVEDDMAI